MQVQVQVQVYRTGSGSDADADADADADVKIALSRFSFQKGFMFWTNRVWHYYFLMARWRVVVLVHLYSEGVMTIISGEFKRLQEFKNCIIIDMDQTCMPYSSLTTLRRILVDHPWLIILDLYDSRSIFVLLVMNSLSFLLLSTPSFWTAMRWEV